jgi:hypothetical protein
MELPSLTASVAAADTCVILMACCKLFNDVRIQWCRNGCMHGLITLPSLTASVAAADTCNTVGACGGGKANATVVVDVVAAVGWEVVTALPHLELREHEKSANVSKGLKLREHE